MAHAPDPRQVIAVQLLKSRHFWLSLVLVLNGMVLVLEAVSSSTSTANAEYEYEYEYEKPWDRTDLSSNGLEKHNIVMSSNA
jgi:hypothetical protein